MDIIMVGIAGMIGGAIFVLTGPAIGLAGSAVILAFILNAIITLFTAMAYAELGSAIPEAGGGYLWIREGLPRPNAFISGWMAWFAHIIAGSLYAVGFGAFLYQLLGPNVAGILSDQPLFGVIPFDKLIAVASIAAFSYINIKGASETGKTGTIVILCLIAAGSWTMYNNPSPTTNFADFMPTGIGGLVAAMGLTFIAFEGYEIIVQTGEEVKNPKRNIPRAIFISLAIVVVLYCLVAFVSIGAISPEGIAAWRFIGEGGELGIMKAAVWSLDSACRRNGLNTGCAKCYHILFCQGGICNGPALQPSSQAQLYSPSKQNTPYCNSDFGNNHGIYGVRATACRYCSSGRCDLSAPVHAGEHCSYHHTEDIRQQAIVRVQDTILSSDTDCRHFPKVGACTVPAFYPTAQLGDNYPMDIGWLCAL
jgi:hypothetical protein